MPVSAASRMLTSCSRKPTPAIATTKISANFSRRATTPLSKRSAISPPRLESRKNGSMNRPPASVTSTGPFSSASV